MSSLLQQAFTSQTEMSTKGINCQAKVAGGKRDCSNGATVFRKRGELKHFCTLHGKALKGEKELTDASPVSEDGPYFLRKLAQPIGKKPVVEKSTGSKAVEKKSEEKKEPKQEKKEKKEEKHEEEHEEHDGCVQPAKSDTGALCEVLTGKKEECGKKAIYEPPEGCDHSDGKPVCGMHWNSLHKAQKKSGGKGKGKKEVAEEDKCTHYNDKTKKSCGRAAYGENDSGDKACWQHGGPKKSDSTTKSDGKAAATHAPSGPLAGANILEIMFKIRDFERDHADCEDCTEDVHCGPKQSVDWLADLLALFRVGGDSSTESVMQIMRIAGATDDGADFIETFTTSRVSHLKDVLGEENMQWLYTLFDRMAQQPGEVGAEIEADWKIIAKELGIKFEKKENKPKGSSEKGGATLSSRKTDMSSLQANLKKAREVAEKKKREAAEKKEEEPAEEEKKVDDEESTVEDADLDIE